MFNGNFTRGGEEISCFNACNKGCNPVDLDFNARGSGFCLDGTGKGLCGCALPLIERMDSYKRMSKVEIFSVVIGERSEEVGAQRLILFDDFRFAVFKRNECAVFNLCSEAVAEDFNSLAYL